MHETYHVDRSSRRRQTIRRVIITVILLAALGGTIYVNQLLKSDTVIQQGTSSVTTVNIATPKTKTVQQPTFKIDLPEDWKAEPPTTDADYHWVSSERASLGRGLDIYVDNIPSTMAYNRLLPVHGDTDHIEVAGDISENCVTFTDEATLQPSTQTASSKWSGVNFICDMGNKFRNVIGTGSAESLNSVTASGAQGTHRYTLVYTDHSARPNDAIFLAMVRSFRAL